LRLSFRWPRKRRLLFIGRTGQSLLRTYISESDFDTYVSPRSELNIWVALHAIMTGSVSTRGYLKSYLRFAQPAFVVTFEDNALEFYLAKVFAPWCKTLAIQNGRRDTHSDVDSTDIWQLIRESVPSTHAPDVVLTHGRPWSVYYRDALSGGKTRIVEVGSVRSNAIPVPATARDHTERRLIFISSFPNLGSRGDFSRVANETFGYWRGVPLSYAQFYSVEALVAQHCAQLANESNLPFVVLGKRPSWQRGEYNYFAAALRGFKWSYAPAELDSSSYDFVRFNDVIVNVDSTLGYELFARGHRVVFVAGRMSTAGVPSVRDTEFAYPLMNETHGEFWSNFATFEETQRVISYAVSTTDADWQEATRQLQADIMPFDPGNQLLCSMLTEVGIKNSGPGFWIPDEIPRN
jgi:surface carbohydrate biosynthesis protein